MGVEDLHWRFGLDALFVIYRRRNQNMKGCSIESDSPNNVCDSFMLVDHNKGGYVDHPPESR